MRAALVPMIFACAIGAWCYPALGVTFCRSYAITQDAYLDALTDVNNASSFSVVWSNADATEQAPVMRLAASALQPGETFDSARVVVFPSASPSHAGTAIWYELVAAPVVTECSWTWRTASIPWNTPGAWAATDCDLTHPLYSFTTWTGSLDSVTVARGSTFSTFVHTNVIGWGAWLILHDDGSSGNGYCQWQSAEGANPPKLRIYGTRVFTPSNRRRAMYRNQGD